MTSIIRKAQRPVTSTLGPDKDRQPGNRRYAVPSRSFSQADPPVPVASTMWLTPRNGVINDGDDQLFTVEVRDQFGSLFTAGSFDVTFAASSGTWQTTNPVATSNGIATNLLQAPSAGTVTVSATNPSLADSATTLTVNTVLTLTSIDLQPAAVTRQVGEVQTYVALLYDQNGGNLFGLDGQLVTFSGGVTEGSWTTTNPAPVLAGQSYAQCDFTTSAAGSATLQAELNAVVGQTTLTVQTSEVTPVESFQVIPAPDEGLPNDTTAYRLRMVYDPDPPTDKVWDTPDLALPYDQWTPAQIPKNANGNYTVNVSDSANFPLLYQNAVNTPGYYDIAATSIDAAGNESGDVGTAGFAAAENVYIEQIPPSYVVPLFDMELANGWLALESVNIADLSSFTAAVWVEYGTWINENRLFWSCGTGTGGYSQAIVEHYAQDFWKAQVKDNTTTQNLYAQGPGTLDSSVNGVRFHCVMTFNQTDGLVNYVNGVKQVVSNPGGWQLGTSAAVRWMVGANHHWAPSVNSPPFPGKLGDLLIWPLQATESQVLSWYNDGLGIDPGGSLAPNYGLQDPYVFFTGTDWTDGEYTGTFRSTYGAYTWYPAP